MSHKVQLILLAVAFLAGSARAEVDLVKVDKSENRMYLFDKGKLIKTYHIALGAHPKGHKQQEGDEKTPEGRYSLDYINENSSFYKAMHISYPNMQDKENAEKLGVSPGGSIMVHGQPNGMGWLSAMTQWFNWTDGCIALKNSDMDDFLRLVRVGTSIQIEW